MCQALVKSSWSPTLRDPFFGPPPKTPRNNHEKSWGPVSPRLCRQQLGAHSGARREGQAKNTSERQVPVEVVQVLLGELWEVHRLHAQPSVPPRSPPPRPKLPREEKKTSVVRHNPAQLGLTHDPIEAGSGTY